MRTAPAFLHAQCLCTPSFTPSRVHSRTAPHAYGTTSATAILIAMSVRSLHREVVNSHSHGSTERTKARPITQGLISVPAAFLWLEVHAVGYFLALSYFGRGTYVGPPSHTLGLRRSLTLHR